MAKYAGRNLFVSFGGQEISGEFRTFTVDKAQNQADATAGNDDYQSFVNTNRTISASMELLVHTRADGGSLQLANIGDVGDQGTLLWGPEGNGTGLPKGGFYATLIKRSLETPYDDVVILSLEWSNARGTVLFDDHEDVWP